MAAKRIVLVTGAAQGGVVSPLLCNVFLHRIDRAWSMREHGVMVRFADLCRMRHKSAYAERRIMPRLASLPWPAGVAGLVCAA